MSSTKPILGMKKYFINFFSANSMTQQVSKNWSIFTRENPQASPDEIKDEAEGLYPTFVGGQDNAAFTSADNNNDNGADDRRLVSSEFVVRKRSILKTSELAGNIESRVSRLFIAAINLGRVRLGDSNFYN